MKEGISVVICCYNSSLRLRPTLEHLYLQKNIPFSEWEIIVVDNASTDHTSETAAEIWNSFVPIKPILKLVHEPAPGLSAAREKGIHQSAYKFVLFCDDDNWLEENYLSIALNTMRRFPEIGALGGKGIPFFEKEEPPYFWENQYHVLAVGSQWHKEGDITDERGVLYGAGMVLNKQAYNVLITKYKFRFQVSDRNGSNLMSSGDHELCLALKRIGYRIFYCKSLIFQHYLPHTRTSINYYKRLFISFGESDAILSVYFIRKTNINRIKNDYRYICLRSCKNIIKTSIILTFTGYYVSLDKYKYISKLHDLYNNLGILRRMLILKNSYKKTIRENPLFNFEND